ncbi:hypothetical protein [Arhodomonas sp. AD133]|uniref:hypothetical protein n=1 Tax=Arhodomonas sp. AD133 TaxID=3415009 RepID=UPI003EBEFAA8
MKRRRRSACAVLASILAASAGSQAAADSVRHCVMIEPDAAGRVPPQVVLSQLREPKAGDHLRVFIGGARVADVRLHERPGIKHEQMLAVARLLRRPASPASPTASDWQPHPERCIGELPAHLVAVGTVTDAPPPAHVPPRPALPRVTLLDLPARGRERQTEAWRSAWRSGTEVYLLPLAAPSFIPADAGDD